MWIKEAGRERTAREASHLCFMTTRSFAQERATLQPSRSLLSHQPLTLVTTAPHLVTLKKVHCVSVATALASMVLPVPGGPNSSTPLKGLRMPVKYSVWGIEEDASGECYGRVLCGL